MRNSWCCPPRPALQPGWRLWSSIHHGRAELELADAWPTPSAPGHKQYFPLKLLSFCPEGAPRGCALSGDAGRGGRSSSTHRYHTPRLACLRMRIKQIARKRPGGLRLGARKRPPPGHAQALLLSPTPLPR